MFNRTENNYTATYIKQQPNDAADAARLYGEVADKANDRVINTRLTMADGFGVDTVKTEVSRDMLADQVVVNVWFKINGKTHKVTAKHNPGDDAPIIQAIAKEVFYAVMDNVAGVLARSIKFDL